MTTGTGIITECSYQKQVKSYSLEENDNELFALKFEYEGYDERIYELIYDYWDKETGEAICTMEERAIRLLGLYSIRDTKYQEYIALLEKKIEEKEKVQGDEV